jgi:hypothetical protein
MGIPTPNAGPQRAQQSVWYNPTDKVVSFQLLGHSGRMEYYEVGPEEELVLPAEYDRGVQVRKNNVVVQGKAPQLIKRGAPAAKIHPSLDVEAQERKEAEEKALAAKAREDRAAVAAAAADLEAGRAAKREAAAQARRSAAEEETPSSASSDKPKRGGRRGKRAKED